MALYNYYYMWMNNIYIAFYTDVLYYLLEVKNCRHNILFSVYYMLPVALQESV